MCDEDPASCLGYKSRFQSPSWSVKSKTGEGVAWMFRTLMEGARPRQTGKRIVGDISMRFRDEVSGGSSRYT